MNPSRILANRFLSLPWVAQVEVAQSVGLWRDGDEKLGMEWTKEVFRRASHDRIAALWDAVESRHADGKNPVNPFAVQEAT